MIPDTFPFLFSFGVATAATAITFCLAIPLAWLRYHHRGPAWNLLDGLLVLPLALPPTVVGLILITLFGNRSPVGMLLQDLGIRILFHWPAAVLAASVIAFPIIYQTSRSAFRQIDTEFIDQARILGLNPLQQVVFLMLPLAWPGIAAGMVLTFLRALGEFGATLMIAGNIPGRTQTAPVALYFAVEAGDNSLAWILCAFLIGISILALLLSGFINRWRDR